MSAQFEPPVVIHWAGGRFDVETIKIALATLNDDDWPHFGSRHAEAIRAVERAANGVGSIVTARQAFTDAAREAGLLKIDAGRRRVGFDDLQLPDTGSAVRRHQKSLFERGSELIDRLRASWNHRHLHHELKPIEPVIRREAVQTAPLQPPAPHKPTPNPPDFIPS